jgi:Na+-transporting NADH:ubiquinone oxidoreductase subunit NqrB
MTRGGTLRTLRTWLTEPRYLIVGLVTLVLVVGQWRFAILGDYRRLAATLGVCVLTELAFSWFVRGKVANLQSAYVSGISLSLLTKPQAGLLWPFALGAFLAISSKYVITYRHRHLWNPSNFAICLLLLLAPESVAVLSHQWGNDLLTNAVIWTFGLIIASRSGVLHLTASYVLSFLALAVLRTAIVGGPFGAEIAPLTGPMYQLFVFFMVTDPRTIVQSRRGQVVVVVIVALVEALIRLAGDFGVPWLSTLYASPPLFALTIVGPIALFADLWRRRAKAEAATAPPVATVPPVATA